MGPEQIDHLTQRFVAAVIARRDAYQAQDVPLHNLWWRRADKVAQQLIERGERGKAAIEALLTHPIKSS